MKRFFLGAIVFLVSGHRLAKRLCTLAILLAGTHMAAQAGDRPDIYLFNPCERMDLYMAMTTYINTPIIIEHLEPPNDKHGSSRFLPWHRRYIKDMEDFLIAQDKALFVPLPRWDPTDVVRSRDTYVSWHEDADLCPCRQGTSPFV